MKRSNPKFLHIVGARPNFEKAFPLIKHLNDDDNITQVLVHTGQHYDKNMSGSFFEQLGIPTPNINLGCSGGSQAEQTAAIMINFEKELMLKVLVQLYFFGH